MKVTGAVVIRKPPANPGPARKSDRAQITLAEVVKRIQESSVIDCVPVTEFIVDCLDDDLASDFADDIIDW